MKKNRKIIKLKCQSFHYTNISFLVCSKAIISNTVVNGKKILSEVKNKSQQVLLGPLYSHTFMDIGGGGGGGGKNMFSI